MDKTVIKIDKSVGKMTTSILENLCKESIVIAWHKKDYVALNVYIQRYASLRSYNGN